MSNFSRLLGIVPKFSSTLSSMMSLNTSISHSNQHHGIYHSSIWTDHILQVNTLLSDWRHQAAEHSLKDLAKASEVQHNSTASAANASEDNTQLDYEEIISQNLAYIYYLKKPPKLRFLYKETLTVITFEKNCLSHKTWLRQFVTTQSNFKIFHTVSYNPLMMFR